MVTRCPLVRHSVSSKAQYRTNSCFSAVILCHRGHDFVPEPLGMCCSSPSELSAQHPYPPQGLLALLPRLDPKAQEVGQVIYSLDLLQGPVLLWDSLETGSLLGHITTNPKKPNKCCLLHFLFLKKNYLFIWLCQLLVAACRSFLGSFFSYSMQTLSCGMWNLVP